MGRPPDIKRIAKEDFDAENRGLVEKLAYPLNSFMEQTRNLFLNNIDFQNLNQEIVSFTVSVDVDGNPLVPTKYRSNLNTRVRGMTCIRALNQANPGTYVDNTPFVDFIQNAQLVTINNIKGLPANQSFRLTFITYG